MQLSAEVMLQPDWMFDYVIDWLGGIWDRLFNETFTNNTQIEK